MSSGIRFVTVEFRLLAPRDIHHARCVPVGVVLHHVTLLVRTPEPPPLAIPTLTTAQTRLRVVIHIHRICRNLSPRRLVRHERLEVVERQFVQSAIRVRLVLHLLADTAHILEHDDRVRELVCEFHDSTGESMQYPLGESFFLVTEFPMNTRLAVFLTPFRDSVVALAFLLELSVVNDERPLRPHRFTIESGERDIALVDVYANKRVAGVGLGHIEGACDRDV